MFPRIFTRQRYFLKRRKKLYSNPAIRFLANTDALTITEDLSSTYSYYKTISDTLTVTEEIADYIQLEVEDTLSITEDLLSTYSYSKSVLDTLTIDDNESYKRTFSKAFLEGLPITETINLKKTIRQDLEDNLTIIDTVDSNIKWRSLIDTLTPSESFSYLHDRFVSDTLTINETIDSEFIPRTPIIYQRLIKDTLILTETIHKNYEGSKSITDTLETIDQDYYPLVLNYYTTLNIPIVNYTLR